MNDSLRGEIKKSIVNICKHFLDLIWVQSSFFLDSCLKITLITVFSNNVAVSITSEDFQTAQDIGVIKFF